MKNDPINPIPGGGAIAIGLTKREYFAALAMQGMLANSYQQDFLNQSPLSLASGSQIAQMAVGQADALIQSLEGRPVEASQIVDSGVTGSKVDSRAIEELKAARAALRVATKDQYLSETRAEIIFEQIERIDQFLKDQE